MWILESDKYVTVALMSQIARLACLLLVAVSNSSLTTFAGGLCLGSGIILLAFCALESMADFRLQVVRC